MDYDLLDVTEKESFLHAFCKRYKHSRKELNKCLTQEETTTAEEIIQFIAQCNDIDILIDLYRYLLSDKFNYLRINNQTSRWQGSNEDGKIVKTSKEWAMIEKSLMLQIANTLLLNSKFSHTLAAERADQLAKSLPFFATKRKETDFQRSSKAYRAFSEGDEKLFENCYYKHFNARHC
ncbi:hypothetical protein [Legionella fallonii]|uniref:Uncharacterized protein n=1 Tax=Legionella fallonii LLAP-10 TaxID=1212491 RepID=A0A098G325_9GAMM|nr:hypothetical protein [Legionella fallonii]CEG56389.1 protein of unknown function [Legionella fallonii LLAP-10]